LTANGIEGHIMADVIYPVTGRSISLRYKDMGDGTFAEVVSVIGASGSGADASAANQLTEIARLEAIRDRLPSSVGAKAGSSSLSITEATGALTSISGTITTGGTAQTLASANSSRRALTVQNTSSGDIRVNPWGTASSTAGFKVAPDQLLVLSAPNCGVAAVSIWGATTGQAFEGAEAV
jgi:hypothetical protein